MKINLAVDLDIHQFSGAGITEYESGLKNLIVHKEGERYKITQRPSINVEEDASNISGLPAKARGIYYWERATTPATFIINNDTVYDTTQDGGEVDGGSEISTGTERVTILETIGTPRMVILDAENNEGWYVNQAASSVTQISDPQFPTTLCHGGAILDSYLFVMDEDGIIYNSEEDDPTSWLATDFMEAERENDKGVYLAKHHDHIVAFGTRTIEFFYNAGNVTGSPLNRRQDLSYKIGCATGLGVWENGDTIYFIGSMEDGQLTVYKMENFQITPVANDMMNYYVSNGVLQSDLTFHLSGVSVMGHDILLMTVYELNGGEIDPKMTISYDSRTNLWGLWATTVSTGYFPLMAWTKRTGGHNETLAARSGEGIMSNGDVFTIRETLVPKDTIGADDGVYEDGVYESGVYVAGTSSTSTNIETSIRTGMIEGDAYEWKFQNAFRVVMENTLASQTLTMTYSDERNDNFLSMGEIDTADTRKEIHQGGRFLKRNYQLDYAGDEQIYIDFADADLGKGF